MRKQKKKIPIQDNTEIYLKMLLNKIRRTTLFFKKKPALGYKPGLPEHTIGKDFVIIDNQTGEIIR
ncbi:MAG: hypothetical protein LBU87_06005 [Lactobacillales bacterium]|jgi:hypothetical protein|nr:hypothetical protein [Lactobacillales bacterium]